MIPSSEANELLDSVCVSVGAFDDAVLSWGGSVGFQYKVAQKIDLDIGYRYIGAEGGDDFRINGTRFRSTAFHANVVYGGVGFHF